MQNRVIMLADFDYFFAQCEELRHPEIKDKPIVVGVYSGRTEDSGAVSTSNYIAREYGVKSGLPLFMAKRKLEGTDAVFYHVDHQYYEQISSRIMAIFRSYATSIEQVSIDEAYLDVTEQVDGSFEKSRSYAQKIKADVKEQVGISFTIGIGPNKLVAKIACDNQKPDGLTIVLPEDAKPFLRPLAVDCLMGVGKKTRVRMEQMGIKTIGDLAKYDCQRLIEVFGKVSGIYFFNAANAIDNAPVVEQGAAESISKIGTLKHDSHDFDFILQKAVELIEHVFMEVSTKGYSYKTVTIYVVNVDLSSKTRSVTLEQPTKDKEAILRNVKALIEKFLAESPSEIRRVGVKVSGFSREEPNQKSLMSFFSSE